MKSGVVKLCIFLFFTVQGSWGSELTINVRKNATVTLVCYINEYLRKCYCPSYPQNCHMCTDGQRLTSTNTEKPEIYFTLSRLKHSDSGLYACVGYRVQKKYRLNVFEDKDPTVVIGTVGQSVVISCGNEVDIMAATEKHWCRLSNANFCLPDTVMGPENETRGDFKILDSHGSFSLEKRQLSHNDTGYYRFTQIFHNQTKVHVVELQVKDENLQISPVRVKPKLNENFEIICQYSQELQEFSKSWLCDKYECPETVGSVDDRFQSALVLTIDHVACSNFKHFQCVAKKLGQSVNSIVYLKPLNKNPIQNVDVTYLQYRKVKVEAYTLLNLICVKPERYRDDDRLGVGWFNRLINERQPYFCKVSRNLCESVKHNVRETDSSLTLQICVTPNDDGTTYRCVTRRWDTDVEIYVAPPPPQPVTPALRIPITRGKIIPRSSSGNSNVGVITIVTTIILFIIIVCVTVIGYKGKKMLTRLFARRTPLSAVDIHANTYANSVAHYYSHHRRQVPPPDKQGEGGDKEASSSSDDEFEELPVRPNMSSSAIQEETDYVMVKPGGAARSQNVHALLKESEQYGQGRLSLRNYDNVKSSSGNSKDDDDEEDVTYTQVFIKPKHEHK